MGISIRGNTQDMTSSDHFLIKNIRSEESYWSAIHVDQNPYNYGIIEDCEVSMASQGPKINSSYGSGWPGSIVVSNSPYSYTTIRRNFVYENYGEGIQITRPQARQDTNNSGYATVEENIIWNNRRVDLYIGKTERNTYRRNLCLGAGPSIVNRSTTIDGRGWNQFGIWVNAEVRTDGQGAIISTSNNHIYNNLIAGHAKGIGISSEYDEGTIENVLFYNNTLIANYHNIFIGHKLSGYTLRNVVFKNNISYCPADTSCQDVNSDQTWHKEKIIFDYNSWTKKPNYIGGLNDQIVNDNWSKTQGWQNLTNIPDIKDFAMKPGNTAINTGIVLSDEFKKTIDIKNTIFSPLKISVETIDQSGSNWDMGAILFY